MQYLIMILIFAKILKTENKSGNVQYIQIQKNEIFWREAIYQVLLVSIKDEFLFNGTS